MSTKLIYFSPTGTTSQIINKIAEGLGNETETFDFTLPKSRLEYKQLSFGSTDFVVVGVPVYSGRIPEFLEDFFNQIQGHETPAVFVALYGNRDYDDALLELKDFFEKRGFKSIAAAAFIGEHSYSDKVAANRPDKVDLNKAFAFGQSIKTKIDNITNLNDVIFEVKGNYPYKERKPSPQIVPQTSEDCNDCGICSELCPMEAINFNNYKIIAPEKCIRCCNCIKKCPENAKSFTDKIIINIANYLEENFADIRKEPEIFGL